MLLTLLNVMGAWAIDNVPYVDANGNPKTANNVTEITNSSKTLSAGWYIVNGTDVQTGTLVCEDEVHLILKDGAKLTANGNGWDAGIRVSAEGASLNIYGQTGQTGQLIANGASRAAGIGGGEYGNGNDITINGGVITANGGMYGAGIGGGVKGNGNNIKINGGKIISKAGENKYGDHGAGIGNGYLGSCSHIYVNTSLLIYADNNNTPETHIAHTSNEDVSASMKNKQNVVVRMPTHGWTVTFDKIGGNGGTDQVTVDEASAMPQIEVPTRDRCVFLGYFARPNGMGMKYYNADGTSANPWYQAENAVLYANWKLTEPLTYVDVDGETKIAETYLEISNVITTLNSGWYVVLGSDVQTGTLVCEGDVHLILADGAKLTATGNEKDAGIRVSADGASLTIYGQTAQTGQLIAKGCSHGYAAGIGGEVNMPGHDITINGGVITATGTNGSAGIGGGSDGAGYNITINGGVITANGGIEGAGIGGGQRSAGKNITINGGEITANGGNASGFFPDGIGKGSRGNSSNIHINTWCTLYADNNNPPATIIEHTSDKDVSALLSGKRYAKIVEKEHVHNYSEDWSKDSEKHWHECTLTEGICTARKKDEAPHSYDNTDLTDDTKAYTCSVCGYVNETVKAQYEARNYMSMTAVGGSVTIGMTKTGSPEDYDLQYSSDRIHWTSVALTATNDNIVEIASGQTCYFRHGSATATNKISSGDNSYWSFTMTGSGTIEADGNIMSLLDATCQQTELPMTPQHVFTKLFLDCERLTVAPRMDAITQVPQWGFVSMFSNTGITAAPALSATHVRDGAYRAMFENCKELVSVPVLTATELARCAYWDMFKGCAKLTEIEIANIESMVVEEGSTGRENSFHDMLANTAVGAKGTLIAPIEMMGDARISLSSNWQWTTKLKANQDPDNYEPSFYTTFYDSRNAYILPEGVKAYTAEVDYNDDVIIILTRIEGDILSKGEAVLLHSNVSGDMLMTVSAENGTKDANNQFLGVDVATSQSDYGPYNYYMLSYGQNRLSFYKMKCEAMITAHKAFIVYSPSAPVNAQSMRMVLVED